jgi:predicted ATPase
MRKVQQSRSEGITEVAVKGYKSLAEERRFAIYPLTILAGANSSGKSSAIQPLLLLKQTLEATYDPGPLLLDGPNVRFTSTEQLLSKTDDNIRHKKFSVEIDVDKSNILTLVFGKPESGKNIDILNLIQNINKRYISLDQGMSNDKIESILSKDELSITRVLTENRSNMQYHWEVVRQRCFLEIQLKQIHNKMNRPLYANNPAIKHGQYIRGIIHVPGLRGNPARTYKTTAVGDEFPGTFENYVASIINHWQSSDDSRLARLSSSLERLGLTWGVEARQLDDTQVELRVGRLKKRPTSDKEDLVNISDVGFGVSQTLPVLVALLTARPGQMVYIEQPEIHLHPRAQSAMARILADAAKRGVRVVVETHSSLLLRSIQTLIAEGYIPPRDVILHWFECPDGVTKVTSCEPDESGAYGDWPEDFDDTILDVEGRYLDAVEAQQKAV